MEEINGIQIKRINHLTIAPLIKKKELLETITRNKPDVVIWCGTLLSAIYLAQLKSIKKPLIWDIDKGMSGIGLYRRISFREVFHPHHTFLLYQALMEVCTRFVIKSVANSALISKIIVPGQYLRESLCKLGVESHKIAIIPSAVEMNRIENSDNSLATEEHEGESCAKTKTFTATYMGSPCTLRGTDTVIRSTKKIVGKCKNVKLIILSRRNMHKPEIVKDYLASEEEYLRKLTKKLQVEDHVEIISGILNGPDLKRYVLKSDVITLPFKMMFSEPPLSVLEAMGLGKVVVTTNLGILPETIGKDRGILIEPGDSDALAQAILFLSEHPKESLQIGNNAKRFVSSLSDWDDLTLEFVNLLKEVVEEA
jgi:glycosyltransferase involved in cell wall biosynthesis